MSNPASTEPVAASEPVSYDDGWCGHCGAVFIDRPSTAPVECDSCGQSLATNPPGGPVPPRQNPVDAVAAFIDRALA